jgi:hypothetical protein
MIYRRRSMNGFHKTAHTTRGLCLVLMSLSCWNAAGLAQTMVVRIVNLRNGKPVKNVQIYVAGVNGVAATEQDEKYGLVAKPVRADMSLRTDANGEATLYLPNAPAIFYLRASLSGSHWDCTCNVRIVSEKVMLKGVSVMSPYAALQHERAIPPKPGELLFV